MSFSSDIKEELSKIKNLKDKEIIESEFLGYILTGNTTNNDKTIEFVTENEFNIEKFYKILFNLNIEYEPSVRGKTYIAIIKKDQNVENLMTLKLKENDEIKKAIVRGAFFFFFSVTDPNKQYHLYKRW